MGRLDDRARRVLPWLAVLVGLCFAAEAGTASVPPPSAESSALRPLATALSGCACAADRSVLAQYRERIAAAASLEEARELAVSETRLARRALRGAQLLAPLAKTITRTHGRLVAYESAVQDADTPEAVAAEFGELLQLASLGAPLLADVDVDAPNCHYTTGEIIAIVLGFILAIIPGIILLILLC